MIAQDRQPYLNTRQDNPFQFFGSPTVMRSTGETTDGHFLMMEQLSMPPGLASPYHVHHSEDEAFYVLEGQVAFVCDGKWLLAGPGTYVYGPREIPHGFRVVESVPARMLLLCAPAGFERFVRELAVPVDAAPAPPDMALLVATAAKYHVDILGPLPELPEGLGTTNAPASTSLRRAVDDARNMHIAAVNAGDAASATALFARDGVCLPPGQPALQGAAIGAWFAYVFGAFNIEGFSLQPAAVDEHGDRATEHGDWKATFHPKNGSPAVAAGGTYLTVYERSADGTARVLRDAFNGLPG